MSNAKNKPDGFEMFCFAEEFRQSVSILHKSLLATYNSRTKAIRDELDLAKDGENPFTEKAKRLMDEQNNFVYGGLASKVVAALCLELFIKCLHRVRGRTPPWGHKYKVIYRQLSIRDRQKIQQHYMSNSAKWFRDPHTGKKIVWPIENVLERAELQFTQLRYGYELLSEARSTLRGNAGIRDLTMAIRSRILEKHPDWESRIRERCSLD